MALAHEILGGMHLIACLVSVGFMVNWLIPFYRLRNDPLLWKRRSKLTVIQVLIGIIGEIVIYSFWSINYVASGSSFLPPILSDICIYALIFLFPIIIYSISFVLLTRFWLCYYDTAFSMANDNLKWKTLINEKYINNKTKQTDLNENIFVNIDLAGIQEKKKHKQENNIPDSRALQTVLRILRHISDHSKDGKHGQTKNGSNNKTNSRNDLLLPILDSVGEKLIQKEHWIVENKQRYGNLEYISKYLIGPFVCLAIVSVLLRLFVTGIVFDGKHIAVLFFCDIFDFVVCFIIIMVGIIIYKKYTIYYGNYDALNIHSELKISCCFYTILFVLYVIMLIFNTILDIIYLCTGSNSNKSRILIYSADVINNHNNEFISHAISVFIGIMCCIVFVGSSYVSTARVMTQLGLTLQNSSLNSKPTLNVKNVSSSATMSDAYNHKKGTNASFATLRSVLEDPIAFDVFAAFLLKQFSIECLLAYIEFLQYKDNIKYCFTIYAQCINQHLIDNAGNNNSSNNININDNSGKDKSSDTLISYEFEEDNMGYAPVNLPRNTPYSSIIYQDCPIKCKLYHGCELSKIEDLEVIVYCVYDQIKQLTEKYINNNSKFEINISGHNRDAVQTFFKNFDAKAFLDSNLHKQDSDVDYSAVFAAYSLFDGCISELYQLMEYSFLQFINTDEYYKLKKN